MLIHYISKTLTLKLQWLFEPPFKFYPNCNGIDANPNYQYEICSLTYLGSNHESFYHLTHVDYGIIIFHHVISLYHRISQISSLSVILVRNHNFDDCIIICLVLSNPRMNLVFFCMSRLLDLGYLQSDDLTWFMFPIYVLMQWLSCVDLSHPGANY